MILPIAVTALIQTVACVLCVGLGYQMGFREGEKSSAKSTSRMTALLEWNTATVNRRNNRCFAIFRE